MHDGDGGIDKSHPGIAVEGHEPEPAGHLHAEIANRRKRTDSHLTVCDEEPVGGAQSLAKSLVTAS